MSLNKTWAIAVREFRSYFVSPVVYAVLTVYLFLTGYFTCATIVNSNQAEFSLYLMLFIFLFLAPLLTMRLIAVERNRGTVEMIFTSPLSSADFVLGKFLAVLGVYGIGLLLTFEFPIFLYSVATPDLWIISTQYLGLILGGGAFLAVGLFCSALTENQVVAAVSSFCVLLFLWVIGLLGKMVPADVRPVVEGFDLLSRLQNFQQGIVGLEDLLFFLALIIFFLYATMIYLNARSWQQ